MSDCKYPRIYVSISIQDLPHEPAYRCGVDMHLWRRGERVGGGYLRGIEIGDSTGEFSKEEDRIESTEEGLDRLIQYLLAYRIRYVEEKGKKKEEVKEVRMALDRAVETGRVQGIPGVISNTVDCVDSG